MLPVKGNRLDRLARHLSRRVVLGRGVVAGLAALVARSARPAAVAQDAAPVADAGADSPAFLFVQLFDEGTWLPKPEGPGVFLLTQTGAGAQTLYFSDRPARIVGTVPTATFLDVLGFTPANPPNTALVVRNPEGERDVLMIELFNPTYVEEFDADGGVSVQYEARLLEAYEGDGLAPWAAEQGDDVLPAQLADVSLFIDDCPDMIDCYGWTYTGFGRAMGWLPIGPMPGGPHGRCWSWEHLLCCPCRFDEGYYRNLCNEAYPWECGKSAREGCRVGPPTNFVVCPGG